MSKIYGSNNDIFQEFKNKCKYIEEQIKKDEDAINGIIHQSDELNNDVDEKYFHDKLIDVFSKFVPRKYLKI
jgi:hypothetical protein